MKRSAIAWTDFSGGDANFVRRGKRGDCEVSPGCEHCYARRIGERFGNLPETTTVYPDKLDRLLHPRKPLPYEGNRRGPGAYPMVFVCDTGDLFHPSVDDRLIYNAIQGMGGEKRVAWQVLTKRADRLLSWFNWSQQTFDSIEPWPSNVWIGVTAENQEQADTRIPLLLQIPAAVRFVSVEPMLGPVNLHLCEHCQAGIDTCGEHRSISWVICGGETGPDARRMECAWIENLYEQCAHAGTPFFLKALGKAWTWEDYPMLTVTEEWPQEWPDLAQYRALPYLDSQSA